MHNNGVTSVIIGLQGEELHEVQLEMDNPTYGEVQPVTSNIDSEPGLNGTHASNSPYHAYEEIET